MDTVPPDNKEGGADGWNMVGAEEKEDEDEEGKEDKEFSQADLVMMHVCRGWGVCVCDHCYRYSTHLYSVSLFLPLSPYLIQLYIVLCHVMWCWCVGWRWQHLSRRVEEMDG